jgi:hypothetical protein
MFLCSMVRMHICNITQYTAHRSGLVRLGLVRWSGGSGHVAILLRQGWRHVRRHHCKYVPQQGTFHNAVGLGGCAQRWRSVHLHTHTQTSISTIHIIVSLLLLLLLLLLQNEQSCTIYTSVTNPLVGIYKQKE